MKFTNKPNLSTKVQRYTGFTLAEVLITLGIIGIVAALTIPVMISHNQKSRYVSELKKAYTQINQSLIKISSDNNCVSDLACTGLFSNGVSHRLFGDEFVKYFKILKNCSTTISGCFSANTKLMYDGSSSDSYNFDSLVGYNYRFVTIDGASIWVENFRSGCQTNWSSGGVDNMNQVCAWLIIDLNGPTPPNALGTDTFWFYITNGKGALLYPMGGKQDFRSGNNYWWKNLGRCKTTNKDGTACAGRVMEEGWKMNY